MGKKRNKKRKTRAGGSSEVSIPKSIPTFQKLNGVLLKDMDKRKESLAPSGSGAEAAEVDVAPVRLQWSQLKAWQAQPYSRYKHIFLKPFYSFSLWLNNIPWWPDLAAECYTESWRDIKMKEEKNKQMKSHEIVHFRRRRGCLMGKSCLLQFVGLMLLSLVPFFKNVTRCSKTHTVPPSRCHGSALCQLLGFVVKRVDDFAHVLNRFQSCFIRFVHRRLFKYDQDAFALVEDSMKLFVQNHLW